MTDSNSYQAIRQLLSDFGDALRVDDESQLTWNEVGDVVVVGYGAAGASAALEAADGGARVVVLDRLNGGGASALSGGVVYAGGGTPYQQQAGVADSVDNMINYLRLETDGVISERTLGAFCQQSPANLAWLEQHGVTFDATSYDKKTSYPPKGYYLYYSGNEPTFPYSERAAPARRGHRVKGDGFTGRLLFGALDRAARRHARVAVHAHCEARRLVVNAQGRVIGVQYQRAPRQVLVRRVMTGLNRLANCFAVVAPWLGSAIRCGVHRLRRLGSTAYVRAYSGVVLSTGGFVHNRLLLNRLAPAYATTLPLGEDCVGGGIALGMGVGADVAHMQNVSAWRFFSPPNCLMKGVIVNERGKRICNEDLYGATTADRILADSGERAFLVIDARIMAEARANSRFADMMLFQWGPAKLLLALCAIKAATPEALARKAGIDPAALVRTVADYNAAVEDGADPLHKAAEFLQPLDSGPYYAMDVSLRNRLVPCMGITLGGLRVDEDSGAVLSTDGKVIDGLYAAGRAAVGVCSKSYISGLSLADCVFSGRRAGRHAALASARRRSKSAR